MVGDIRYFIEYVVRRLVRFPDEVDVLQIDNGNTINYLISVNAEDVGRVVGKHGKTINAIRSLANTVSSKTNIRAVIDVAANEKPESTQAG
ncbi:MAG: KH domain-containing protein [Methylacidiphilales bacterium]|nr:KH domain-containing protein [Candidatus Methylacidiphilales bacterium]MDW8350105.1 KH domain-containing protein [Verrucomicrobiae bacterium]